MNNDVRGFKGKCTCGAAAVFSDRHSDYCDSLDNDVITEFCERLRKERFSALYVASSEDRRNYVFDEFERELMPDLDFAAMGVIKMGNDNYITVIDEEMLSIYTTVEDFNAVVIEDEDLCSSLEHLISESAEIYVVDSSFEVLEVIS